MAPEFIESPLFTDAVNEPLAETGGSFLATSSGTAEVIPLAADTSSAIDRKPEPGLISSEATGQPETIGQPEAIGQAESTQEERAEAEPVPLVLTPDQEVRALLTPSEITIAAARGELRLAEGIVHDQPLYYTDSPQFRECKTAYDEVKRGYDAALQQLLEVMDDPAPRSIKFGNTKHVSWHYHEPTSLDGRPLQMPDGQKVRLAHEVIATVRDEDNRLQREYASECRSALVVRTHVIHTPRHGLVGNERALTGTMALDVVNDADAIEHCFPDNEVVLATVDDIASDLTSELMDDARLRAVRPWIEDFLQLPPLTGAPEFLTSGYAKNAVTELVTYAPVDAYEARHLLSNAFGNGRADLLRNALDMPLREASDRARQHSALPRYSWLMQHASALQTTVQNAERVALSLGFQAPFMERLALEEAKVARIRALAEMLGTMVNINANAPEQSTR